jgi:hypothetical protein
VKLKEDESFEYTKVYKNFDKVAAGEIIAWERGQPIKAERDGYITLVNYPEKTRVGDDIFFFCELIG